MYGCRNRASEGDLVRRWYPTPRRLALFLFSKAASPSGVAPGLRRSWRRVPLLNHVRKDGRAESGLFFFTFPE